jgi:hypothetical protein
LNIENWKLNIVYSCHPACHYVVATPSKGVILLVALPPPSKGVTLSLSKGDPPPFFAYFKTVDTRSPLS